MESLSRSGMPRGGTQQQQQQRSPLGTTLELGQGVRRQGQLCKLHTRGQHQYWTQIWVRPPAQG